LLRALHAFHAKQRHTAQDEGHDCGRQIHALRKTAGGNGAEICIAYEDGMVIVGTVEGSRLWSKDVGARLSLIEWAPNGQALLFATAAAGPDLCVRAAGAASAVRRHAAPCHANLARPAPAATPRARAQARHDECDTGRV
jgi:hypothetical protein